MPGRGDLLAEVGHVRDVVSEPRIEGERTLGLEELEVKADVGGVPGGHGGSPLGLRRVLQRRGNSLLSPRAPPPLTPPPPRGGPPRLPGGCPPAGGVPPGG